MDLTVSRPVKILALVLVLSGVAGIASMSLLGKGSSGSSSAGTALSVAQIRARAHARAKKAQAAPTHRAAAPKTPAAKPAAPKKPASLTAANGLPVVLADALRAHRIVVVSVFDPQSQTDAVSYAEARAGAADAGAGFLGVNVLDDTVAGPLTSALPSGGLLPLPGILVYRAPSTLVERVDGFADRASVAALALNAKTAEPVAATAPAAPATTPAAPSSPLP